MSRELNEAEADILVEVQKGLLGIPGILPTARTLSRFGEHALGWMGLAAAGAVVDKPRRTEWIAMGASAFSAHAASVIIKRVVRRRRPHDERIKVGVGTPSKLSFPSSHATSTSAALVCVADITGSKLPLVGIPVMMASRMVLGVHYPTDTLVGAALGATAAKVVPAVIRPALARPQKDRARARARSNAAK